MSQIHATGRRKEAVARVYIAKGKGTIVVNKRAVDSYFSNSVLRAKVFQPLTVTGLENKIDVIISLSGGGLTGQAEAARLAIARAVNAYDAETRKVLKPLGLFTRDSREVERKKYGQKGARKKFQFSKR